MVRGHGDKDIKVSDVFLIITCNILFKRKGKKYHIQNFFNALKLPSLNLVTWDEIKP